MLLPVSTLKLVKQVAVDLDIVAEYGSDMTAILRPNQKKSFQHKSTKWQTWEVIEVNVNVENVKTREQFEKDSNCSRQS